MGITPDFRPRPAKPKTAAQAAARAREEAVAARKAVAAKRRRKRWTIVLVAAAVLAVVFAVISFDLLTPAAEAAEGEALRALGQIVTAEIVYSARHGDRGFAATLGDLGPGAEGLIEGRLAVGQVAGYTFTLTPGDRDEQGRLRHFAVTARPMSPGLRSFYSNETGVIRFTEENRLATGDDPPLVRPVEEEAPAGGQTAAPATEQPAAPPAAK